MRALRSGIRVGLVLAFMHAPARAWAQSEADLANARRLFRDALAQEVAADWAGALAKLEQVARVKLTPQVRYHVARCKEHLGRYTEALGDYRLAEYEAQQAGASELPEIARARKDLQARVPKLRVVVRDAAAGASVTLDDVELGAPELSVAIPVNPGAHRLVAKLGQQVWRKTFTARERHTTRVTVELPAPSDGDHPAPAAAPDPLPWVAAGVGAAGLVGAGVFYAVHAGAERDLDATCRGSVCPESMRGTQDRSKLFGTLTGASLAVGSVGLGTAAVLWLSHDAAPPKDDETARLRVDATLAPGWRGVTIGGGF